MASLYYLRSDDILIYDTGGQLMDAENFQPLPPQSDRGELIVTFTPEQVWPDEVIFVSTQEGYLLLSAPGNQINVLLSQGNLNSPIRSVHEFSIIGPTVERHPFNPRLIMELDRHIGRPLSEVGQVLPREEFRDIAYGIAGEEIYYLVNETYFYNAQTLELEPEPLEFDNLFDLGDFETHPVFIQTSLRSHLVDSYDLMYVEGRILRVVPLILPDLDEIVPGAQTLPPADIPEFNRDLLQELQEAARTQRVIHPETLELLTLVLTNDRLYYLVNGRYAYNAQDLTREEWPEEFTGEFHQLISSESYQSQPVFIRTTNSYRIITDANIPKMRGDLLMAVPLLLPNRDTLIPDSTELPPLDLPPFNPNLLRKLQRLARERKPISELNRIPGDEEFEQNYLALISRLYGFPIKIPNELLYQGERIPVISSTPPGAIQIEVPISLQVWGSLVLMKVGNEKYLVKSAY